jgi:hypothetical protein
MIIYEYNEEVCGSDDDDDDDDDGEDKGEEAEAEMEQGDFNVHAIVKLRVRNFHVNMQHTVFCCTWILCRLSFELRTM